MCVYTWSCANCTSTSECLSKRPQPCWQSPATYSSHWDPVQGRGGHLHQGYRNPPRRMLFHNDDVSMNVLLPSSPRTSPLGVANLSPGKDPCPCPHLHAPLSVTPQGLTHTQLHECTHSPHMVGHVAGCRPSKRSAGGAQAFQGNPAGSGYAHTKWAS